MCKCYESCLEKFLLVGTWQVASPSLIHSVPVLNCLIFHLFVWKVLTDFFVSTAVVQNLHYYYSIPHSEELSQFKTRRMNFSKTYLFINCCILCFCRDNPSNQIQGVIQVKATKSGMPMKVAQRIDISKFMSYIEVR